MWKNTVERGRVQMAIYHDALHAGYPRLQRYTQNMEYSLLFHGNNSYMNAPQC